MSGLTQVFSDPFNVTKPTETNSKFVTRIPGPEKPMVFKLLGDPRSRQAYIPMEYYSHMIGPDPEKHVRQHPSLKSLGVTSSAPENDAYWEAVKKISSLRKSGENKTPDGEKEERKQQALLKKYRAQERGWFFYYEPNSSEIRSVRLPKDVINQLFGKAATEHRPEVPSLLKELGKSNISPYDTQSNIGWLTLYKTGEGLGTKYTVALASSVSEVELHGKKFKRDEPTEYAVSQKIKSSDVTLEDFPDPVAHEKQYAMTLEETVTFVNSQGTVVPERMLKKMNNDEALESEGSSAPGAGLSAPSAALDEIPF